MADRGLYARWLYQAIQQQGWHPVLRIREQGRCRRQGEDHYVPLASILQQGKGWSGKVRCFQGASAQLDCTLMAARGSGYAESWLLVTDLEPHQAQAAWYQLRFWIEPSFKDGKRGLWQWQHSKMTHLHRAERLCLVMTVATLWLVSVAGQVERALPASSLDALPPTHVARQRATGRNDAAS